jgi:hypothetical protein
VSEHASRRSVAASTSGGGRRVRRRHADELMKIWRESWAAGTRPPAAGACRKFPQKSTA